MLLLSEELRALSLETERSYPGARGLNRFVQQQFAVYKFVRRFISAGNSILDIGSGAGYGAHFLSKFTKSVIAIDYSHEAVGYSSGIYDNDNLQYVVMDARDLAFSDCTFDIVCSVHVIEHLQEVEKFLSEAKRVLRQKGVFIVATPNKETFSPGYSSSSSPLPYHVREWYKDEFENLLSDYFGSITIYGTYLTKRSISIILYTMGLKILQIMDILKIQSMRESLDSSLMAKIDAHITTDNVHILQSGASTKSLDLVAVCVKEIV